MLGARNCCIFWIAQKILIKIPGKLIQSVPASGEAAWWAHMLEADYFNEVSGMQTQTLSAITPRCSDDTAQNTEQTYKDSYGKLWTLFYGRNIIA